MTEHQITYRSDFGVKLIDYMGDERRICDVARVTTPSDHYSRFYEAEYEKDTGLLRMLMRDRHGTPFEAVTMSFYIETPIFLNREFFRHRIASYNETSARYRVLEPVFYMPPRDRPMEQKGKPGAYEFAPGESWKRIEFEAASKSVAQCAWDTYRHLLSCGIAREVARNCLPVNIYSPFYVTLNLRALFNFLSLRHVNESTTVPTFPQWEIDQVAGMMEQQVAAKFPRVMDLFNEHGRVSP